MTKHAAAASKGKDARVAAPDRSRSSARLRVGPGSRGYTALRELSAHQNTWKCQTSPHRHIDWPDRLETGRPIEPFSVQCRKAMQFAYAECPRIVEATSKQGAPNSSPRPLGMSCKVADVRFPFNDLSASRPRCRPSSASDKAARPSLRNVVGARPEQCGVGLGHKRQRAV